MTDPGTSAGTGLAALGNPVGFLFGGLPAGWQVVFTVALVVVVTLLGWSVTLYLRAVRWRPPEGDDTDDLLWVFIVPAFNEAVTIRDSVSRLMGVDVARRRIVVVDDGSDDATPEVLASIGHPDLRVIRRDPPRARRGKAAADRPGSSRWSTCSCSVPLCSGAWRRCANGAGGWSGS